MLYKSPYKHIKYNKTKQNKKNYLKYRLKHTHKPALFPKS